MDKISVRESEQLSVLEEFLKDIPLEDSISIPPVFNNRVGGMKYPNHRDLLRTFTGHLLSKCIWVPASVERTEYGKFCYSDLGKRMINDLDKKTLFIREFLDFYNKEYA